MKLQLVLALSGFLTIINGAAIPEPDADAIPDPTPAADPIPNAFAEADPGGWKPWWPKDGQPAADNSRWGNRIGEPSWG